MGYFKIYTVFFASLIYLPTLFGQNNCKYCDSLKDASKIDANYKAYKKHYESCLTFDTTFYKKEKIVSIKKESTKYEVLGKNYCSTYYLYRVFNTVTDDLEFGFEVEKNDTIYHKVDNKNAQFPGGERALLEFVKNKINYPKVSRKQGVQGTVYMSFVINTIGKIEDIYIIKGLDENCNAQAINVVKSMPNWEPGIYNNRNIKMKWFLPVKFVLK